MKTKNLLSILLMGLLVMTFFSTAGAANGKPDYALEQGDVQGWWRYDEGQVLNIEWSGFNLSMWWQIWINNQTAQENATMAWANATKAICIMLITLPEDIEDEWWFALKIWFQIIDYTNINLDGFDHDLMWTENGVNLGIATEDEDLVLILGYNDTGAPGDPFTRWWAMMAPTSSSSVTLADIEYLLEAQADSIDEIPGFELPLLCISLAILIGLSTKYKKNRNFLTENKF